MSVNAASNIIKLFSKLLYMELLSDLQYLFSFSFLFILVLQLSPSDCFPTKYANCHFSYLSLVMLMSQSLSVSKTEQPF